jgi:hypothetical protein
MVSRQSSSLVVAALVAFAAACAAAPALTPASSSSSSSVLHGKVSACPKAAGWTKGDRADPEGLVDLTIAVKQSQAGVANLEVCVRGRLYVLLLLL